MKRNIIICLLMTLFYFSANAQLYYDEDQVRKEQEVAEEEARRIEEYNEFIRANQVDYDELHNRINNKLSDEIKKAQNQSNNQTNVNNSNNSSSSSAGIQIVNDDYDKVLQERRQAAARQRAKEQAQKAKRDAEYRQMLARRRAEQAAAAEKRRQRLERERIEQERRYKKAVADEYKKSAAHYNSLHAGVDYKATEGYERMYNTQPEGTERMQSSYMPSSIHIAKADIAYVIPKHSSGHTVPLTLNGNELSTLNSSDYDEAMKEMYDDFVRHQMKEIPRYDENIWKNTKPAFEEQLPTQLTGFIDEGQEAFFKYIMRKNNGKKMPIYEGVDEKGQFVFCSEDKNKIFIISKEDASIHIIKFENHSGEDENIVTATSRGTFKDQVKYSGSYNKGEFLSKEKNIYKNKGDKEVENDNDKGKQEKEKDKTDDNIKKILLPQAEGNVVLNFLDNSLKWTEESYSVGQQSSLAGTKINVSLVGGRKGEISGGEKAEITASGSVSFSSGINGSVSVGGSVFSVGIEGSGGMIVGIGKTYYMATGSVGGNLNAGIDVGVKVNLDFDNNFSVKQETKLGVAKIKIGGTILECLNCEEQNNEAHNGGGGR